MRKLLGLLLITAAGTALVRSVVIPWWQTWGRRVDDAGPLPGDDLVANASAIETRGIDIDAPPDAVWPWLAQMGYGRGGWYSYDALDMDRPSANAIEPRLVSVEVGDVVPTHPGGGFVVRVADAPHAMVLYSDTDLVRRQAAEADAGSGGTVNIRATGAFLEAAQPADFAASWAFVVKPAANGSSRLVERFRVRFGTSDKPWHAVTMPMMDFGVFVMMRKQMLGIRDRVERLAHAVEPTAAVATEPQLVASPA